MTHRTYSFVVAVLVGLSMGLVAGLNWLIDPFNIFDSPRIVGVNAAKPFAYYYEQQSKSYRIERLRPEALILGNSRPNFGLDPEHPVWKGLLAYNAAYGGGSLFGAIEYYKQASRLGRLRQIVLAVDIDMMRRGKRALSPMVGNPDNFFKSASSGAGSRLGGADGIRWATLFSLDSTIVSLKTLECQRTPQKFELLKSGLVRVNPGLLGKSIPQRFEAVEARWARFIYHPDEKGKATYVLAPRRLNAFREILRLAYSQGVAMTVMINPSHARKYVLYRQAGLEDQIFAFKRALVQINEDEARQAGRIPFPIWDFFNFNQYTTEPVPDGMFMRWWIDASHYTPELGSKLMDRMFEMNPDPTFGTRLDSSVMERVFAQDHHAAELYDQSHSADVDSIRALVHRARVAAENGTVEVNTDVGAPRGKCDVE